MNIERPKVTVDDINRAFDYLKLEYMKALVKKGDGAFVSAHEMRGVLDEEVEELHDEIKANDDDRIEAETIDIGVVVIHQLASRWALAR